MRRKHYDQTAPVPPFKVEKPGTPRGGIVNVPDSNRDQLKELDRKYESDPARKGTNVTHQAVKHGDWGPEPTPEGKNWREGNVTLTNENGKMR